MMLPSGLRSFPQRKRGKDQIRNVRRRTDGHVDGCAIRRSPELWNHESPLQVTIKVPNSFMNVLQEWKEEQQANRIRFGDQYYVSDYIFTWIDGNPLHPDTVSKWFRDFIDRNGLPKMHLP